MTLERYRELLAAGPEITAEDRKRLARFEPRLTPIAAGVRFALHYWRHFQPPRR